MAQRRYAATGLPRIVVALPRWLVKRTGQTQPAQLLEPFSHTFGEDAGRGSDVVGDVHQQLLGRTHPGVEGCGSEDAQPTLSASARALSPQRASDAEDVVDQRVGGSELRQPMW